MLRRCVLASIIAGGMLPAVYADNGNKDIDETIKANSFFVNSKIELSTNNTFKHLNAEEQNKMISTAWGQGLALNYKSGYLWNVIGFDASYYGAIKLAASEDFYSRNMLAYKDPKAKKGATGFNKVGQRYVKAKIGNNKRGIDLKYGWQELSRFGAITRSYQLTPNTYLGATGGAHFDDFRLRAGYLTSNIARNNKNKIPFTQIDKKIIDHVVTGDFRYNSKKFQANYFYGKADNYTERHGLELALTPNDVWKFGTKVYNTHALTGYKVMKSKTKPYDNNAWHYVAEGEWRQNGWYSRLGLTYSDSDRNDGKLGYFPRHFAGTLRSNINSGVNIRPTHLP